MDKGILISVSLLVAIALFSANSWRVAEIELGALDDLIRAKLLQDPKTIARRIEIHTRALSWCIATFALIGAIPPLVFIRSIIRLLLDIEESLRRLVLSSNTRDLGPGD